MRSERGFTLIELMVVIVLVGIVFTSAIMLMPSPGRDRQQQELAQFRALYERAAQRALLESVPYGIGVWERGYAFFRLAGNWQWLPVEDAPALRQRRWDEDLWPELYLEGIKTSLQSGQPEARPQLYLFPDGNRSPFLLKLHSDIDDFQQLEVNGRGEVTVAKG